MNDLKQAVHRCENGAVNVQTALKSRRSTTSFSSVRVMLTATTELMSNQQNYDLPHAVWIRKEVCKYVLNKLF